MSAPTGNGSVGSVWGKVVVAVAGPALLAAAGGLISLAMRVSGLEARQEAVQRIEKKVDWLIERELRGKP